MNEDLFSLVVHHSKEIKVLDSIMNVLVWDQETMLPHAGASHRAIQKTQLAGLIHTKKIDDAFFARLDTLHNSLKNDDSDNAIIIKRLHRDILLARKLTSSFVERFTEATSKAFFAWEAAKGNNDWKAFEPHLKTIVELSAEKAELLGFSNEPYDALLDEHEPEMTTKEVQQLFSSLKPQLQSLLSEIQNTPFCKDREINISSSLHDQIAMSHELLTFIGFDWKKGRMDTSAHPFSMACHPNDSRLTIRGTDNNTLGQLLSAMHEAGHSFYETGLDQNYYGTPLCEAVSLGVHESQSRFWETVIGRSKQFCPHLYKLLKKYNCINPSASVNDLYFTLNQVKPSFIRTEADEVTYPFHVFLRFDIERELLNGTLQVHDVPERWNSGMKATLGIVPPTHSVGCLQDIHWAFGMFGYFPTYVLGSMYAACFWSALQKSIPNAQTLIEQGTFAPISSWLQKSVWSQGRRFSSKKLIERVLQKPPSEEAYVAYLRGKYTS
jgi:carboxypeptidase Taq